jgi:hypothetical protein
MGSGLGVVTAELNGLATGMESNPWFSPSVQVVAPDDLRVARSAAVNLNENARVLEQYQKWAEAENKRTAEMLRIAATAYEDVDAKYGDRFDAPGRQADIEAITVPVPSTPMPALPDGPPAMQPLSAGDYSDVNQTQQLLTAGDQGASLDVAEVHWAQAATSVQAHAAPQKVTSWEGDAADAARERMNKFSEWLQNLSAAWQRLSQAAIRVNASHTNALAEHTNIYTRYKFLEVRLQQLAAQVGPGNAIAVQNEMVRIQQEMQDLQRRSDEVREEYANNATFDQVQVDNPPFASSSPAAGPGAGGGGGGGGRPTGDPAAMADTMAQSLGQPRSGAGGAPSSAGAPSGGGAPWGGGAPSGGSGTGGGMPASTPTTTTPKPPTDLGLRPAAAAGGGGSGGGAGGGAGGGGGLPPAPMSAAVKAETVAPGPTVPAGAAAGAGPSAGSAVGGMGAGMAPMGHGAGAQQGKEKRRDPRLAPDEDLYTEDRSWTEAVIGQRRRREVQDSGEDKDS